MRQSRRDRLFSVFHNLAENSNPPLDGSVPIVSERHAHYQRGDSIETLPVMRRRNTPLKQTPASCVRPGGIRSRLYERTTVGGCGGRWPTALSSAHTTAKDRS